MQQLVEPTPLNEDVLFTLKQLYASEEFEFIIDTLASLFYGRKSSLTDLKYFAAIAYLEKYDLVDYNVTEYFILDNDSNFIYEAFTQIREEFSKRHNIYDFLANSVINSNKIIEKPSNHRFLFPIEEETILSLHNGVYTVKSINDDNLYLNAGENHLYCTFNELKNLLKF